MFRSHHIVAGGLASVMLASAASALTITLEYDPNADDAVDCCDGWACCGGTADPVAALNLHMAVAAAFWEDIIEDPHNLHIRYYFSTETSPDAHVSQVDGFGQPTEARIRIPAHIAWYYDSNPINHDEFEMGPKLFRDMLVVEQNEAFSGAPIENLEVGFNGPEVDPIAGPDLLTVILHEMGHAVGLHPAVFNANNSCVDPGDPYYYPAPGLAWGGGAFGIKAFELNDGTFDCGHLALGGITDCNGMPQENECKAHQSLMWPGALPNRRALPGVVDILAVAEAAGWTQIDLPRKYRVNGGAWSNDGDWVGQEEPDDNDHVYLVNVPGITLNAFANASTQRLTVTGNNTMNVVFGKTDFQNDVNATDNAVLQIDFGAELEASQIYLEGGAELSIAGGGLVDAFYVDNDAFIVGAGTLEVNSLNNRGDLSATANGPFVLTSPGTIDLDGQTTENQSVIRAESGDLIVDAPVADPVRARLVVGPNHFMQFNDGWEQQQSFFFNQMLVLDGVGGDATVIGDSDLSGRTEVDGTGVFDGYTVLRNTGEWILADGASLFLEGVTDYDGGSIFAPNATVRHMAGGRIVGNTTIGPVEVFDMDGGGTSGFSVFPATSGTINAGRLDTAVNDGMDGNLAIDGALTINTDAPWRLEGIATFNFAGGQVGTLAGSPFRLDGAIAALHDAFINAEMTASAGTTIHTAAPDAAIVMATEVTHTLEGAAMTGDGQVLVNGPAELFGFGSIEPELTVGGRVAATGGWLSIDGGFGSLTGMVGPLDETGVLWVPNAWNTGFGTLHVRDGWVGGGNISNSSSTTGHGFLAVNALINRGRVAPGTDATGDGSGGAGGILAMTGDFIQAETGALELELGGTALETYDGLIVDGDASLDGALHLSLANGYVPQLGDTFPIIAWNAHSGSFADVTGTQLPAGLQWELDYRPDVLQLTAVEGCAGDANGDGAVDFQDLVLVLANWGPCPAANGCPPDVSHDGIVDFSDVLLVLSGWGGC